MAVVNDPWNVGGSAPAPWSQTDPPPLMLLDRPAVTAFLTLQDCIEGVAAAFAAHANRAALAPGLLHIDGDGGEFHIKAGGLRGTRTYFACKINGGFFGNRERHGLPNILGLILLSDGATGVPLALMESGRITGLRTAAATAVAAHHLARADTEIVTICGAGVQAEMQLRALKHALPALRRAHVWSRNGAERFAQRMSSELQLAVHVAADLAAATRDSRVIVTCTPSRSWFLGRAHVRPGTFIAAVGADSPDKQEIEPELLVHADVVCDLAQQCVEVGELHHAVDAGLMTLREVRAELGAIVARHVPGRRSDDEIIVFDSTGTALQDAAAAALVYERATAQGYPRRFAFWR